MSHAAVLLAGGKSSRMGRDKSVLAFKGDPLWQHQVAILRATGPAELFISGKSDGPYADGGVKIVADETPDCGPLGAIASSLRRCKYDHLLVLAVDMPAMTSQFLFELVEQARRTGRGVVPAWSAEAGNAAGRESLRKATGDVPVAGVPLHFRMEPLAAVYPRSALPLAEEFLGTGERKVEKFVRVLEACGLVAVRRLEAGETALFANWNTPTDVSSA